MWFTVKIKTIGRCNVEQIEMTRNDIYVPKCWVYLSMDFLIDGQISSFCPDQPEGVNLEFFLFWN